MSPKKCLALKDRIIEGQKADEEAIVHQMGEMADFFEQERLKEENDAIANGKAQKVS